MENQDATPIQSFTPHVKSSYPVWFAVLIFLFISAAGVYVGKYVAGSQGLVGVPTTDKESVKTEKSEGIMDKKRFPDKAEGKLVEGGIDGEGNFHLERSGGESQNVYLTSSIVDLSKYIGKKVRVWGETFSGQKAGWLMDVGYVENL